MKKFISILLCVFCVIGLTACTDFPEVDGNYIVLEVQKKNYGEIDKFKDTWVSSTYSLNANGELTCRDSYSFSGDITKTTTVTKDTVLMLADIVEAERHARDNLKIDDGVIYELNYYDKNKQVLVDYKGILTPKYEDIVNTLRKAITKAENETFSKKGLLMEFKTAEPNTENKSWELSQSGNLVYKEGDVVVKEIKLNEDQLTKVHKMLDIQNDTLSRGKIDYANAWHVGYYDATGKCLIYFSGNLDKYPNLLEIYDLIVALTVQ